MKNNTKSAAPITETQKAFQKKYPWIVKAIDQMKSKGFHLSSKYLGKRDPKALYFKREYNGIMQEIRVIDVYDSGKMDERRRDINFVDGMLSELLKETQKAYRRIVPIHNAAIKAEETLPRHPEAVQPDTIDDLLDTYETNVGLVKHEYDEYLNKYKEFYDVAYADGNLKLGIFMGCKSKTEIIKYYKVLEINRDMADMAGEGIRFMVGEKPFKKKGYEGVSISTIFEARKRFNKYLVEFKEIEQRIEKEGLRQMESATDRSAARKRIAGKNIKIIPTIIEIEKYGYRLAAMREVMKDMGIRKTSTLHAYLYNKGRYGSYREKISKAQRYTKELCVV